MPESHDADHDWQMQALVIVHRDIAKPHHPLEHARQFLCDPSSLLQQAEHIPRTLGNPQALPPDQVISHVQRCLAGTLDIENGVILTGEIAGKTVRIRLVLLARPRHTALYGRLKQCGPIIRRPPALPGGEA